MNKNITRRSLIRTALISTVGVLTMGMKGCGSKPDKSGLMMASEVHWKRLFPGQTMQIGGNPGRGWTAVGIVPSGDIVWIED